jgi:hypothetical protein
MYSPTAYVRLRFLYVYTSLATCTPCAFSNPLINGDKFGYAAQGGLQRHGERDEHDDGAIE